MNGDPAPRVSERWPAHWYAVACASSLGSKKPLGVERLGKHLVLWRDASGAARCADAACPHRGANLGLGWLQRGELECPYHGFRFDTAGTCTLMPCEGSTARPSRGLCLRMHPVREAHGFIWAYLGEKRREEVPGLPALPWPAGAPEPDSHSASLERVWNARFTRVMEGMMDLHHFPFAHRRFSPPGYTRLEPYEVGVEGGVIRSTGWLRKESSPSGTGMRFDIHVAYPGVISVRFLERMGGIAVCTPVNSEHTWIAARYTQGYVRVPGLGWLLARLALALEFQLIQPDDYRMVRSSLPRSGSLEHGALIRADRAIVAWHRLHEEALGGASDTLAAS
ncbi:Rieske 2Fe-2S domain-containing protein [Archangium sp.]|uniref:Rieske 2Fe-2S domain-containing protein n=1 Tax=Archangium sp. TaxID=1872627 RepID=UPI002D67DE24|nr:Rieske 2Fe-2S domain-containing protein [Archangium sp.]HYO56332.1 Rieske 2Fe-2S domain-containing protein [Archangium sp.]